MSEPIRFEVLPDEYIEEDETVRADELFQDIMAGFMDMERHAQGEITLRITERVVAPTENRFNLISLGGTSVRGHIAHSNEVSQSGGTRISLPFLLSSDRHVSHKVLKGMAYA